MKRVFISSTFSDMQSERDMIRSSVLPSIKDFFRKFGYDISFTDLRWGISSESIDSNVVMDKILSVCTREISACRQHLIILLGNRYGTVPNEVIMQKFLDANKNISYEESKGKSITELEILYALKKELNEGPIALTVCIRNSNVYDKMDVSSKNAFVGIGEDRIGKK